MIEIKCGNSNKNTFSDKHSNVKIIMKSKYVALIFIEDEFGNKFVSSGDRISKGKLIFKMNYLNINIDFFSPCDCIVENVFVTNNSMVQYGERIISIIQV